MKNLAAASAIAVLALSACSSGSTTSPGGAPGQAPAATAAPASPALLSLADTCRTLESSYNDAFAAAKAVSETGTFDVVTMYRQWAAFLLPLPGRVGAEAQPLVQSLSTPLQQVLNSGMAVDAQGQLIQAMTTADATCAAAGAPINLIE